MSSTQSSQARNKTVTSECSDIWTDTLQAQSSPRQTWSHLDGALAKGGCLAAGNQGREVVIPCSSPLLTPHAKDKLGFQNGTVLLLLRARLES